VGEYTLGESLKEGNRWFGGRMARSLEVAVAMEREVRGRKKERKKEEARRSSAETLCT
jgi:hypothetical protein